MPAFDPELLLALADDNLLLGQRASEWVGRAPLLEEELAFANLALDELGHAGLWYSLLAGWAASDAERFTHQMIYWRAAEDFRCAQLVELPNGDWAFAILRQYLCDAAELACMEALAAGAPPDPAQAPDIIQVHGVAQRIAQEERYHLRHSRMWLERLAHGTDESLRRLQAAVDALWPYTAQLHTAYSALAGAALGGPAAAELERLGLRLPPAAPLDLPRAQHTLHLAPLLSEMQSVARLDPEAEW